MTADRFPLGRWPVFFEKIGTAVWTALDPAVALMDHYDPCPADDYMEKINRMRLYESADDAGLLNASGCSDPRSDLVSGIVCESFGYAVQDTAALNAAAVRYRRLVGSDRRLAETLGSRDRPDRNLCRLFRGARPRRRVRRKFLERADSFAGQLPSADTRIQRPARPGFLRFPPLREKERTMAGDCLSASLERRPGRHRALRRETRRRRPNAQRSLSDGIRVRIRARYRSVVAVRRREQTALLDQRSRRPALQPDDATDAPDRQFRIPSPRRRGIPLCRRGRIQHAPIEKYKGSAIFFHIESGFDRGTAGCTASPDAKPSRCCNGSIRRKSHTC